MADTHDILVGSTGFVGCNLMERHSFWKAVHSTNINEAYGTNPDLVVYAGVPSAMFLANTDPEGDLRIMGRARENLRRIAPKKVVLISSIAVYADSRGRDETLPPMPVDGLPAYGRNRLQLEEWVREDFPDALIVRLPALYGKGLKKNFLHDIVHPAPSMLKDEKMRELAHDDPTGTVRRMYARQPDGWWRPASGVRQEDLDAWFRDAPFNALAFTDSRSRFQFYDLACLWDDITKGIVNGWDIFNISTPPVSAGEVMRFATGREWVNEFGVPPFDYDMRTCHSPRGDGYLCSLDEELAGIRAFIQGHAS